MVDTPVDDRMEAESRPRTVGLRSVVSEGLTPMAVKVAVVAFGSDLVFGMIRAWQLLSREPAGRRFRLDVDGSLPEIVQYGKFLVIAGFMVHLTRTTGRRWYLAWAATFTFLMLDDSLMLHERVSGRLQPLLSTHLPAGTNVQAIGELGYFAMVAGGIAALGLAGMASSAGSFRRLSIDLILLLGLGAVFAVGVDVVHGLLDMGYLGNNLVAVVEDGGEMVVVSLIVVYSAMVVGHRGNLHHWLTDIRRSTR